MRLYIREHNKFASVNVWGSNITWFWMRPIDREGKGDAKFERIKYDLSKSILEAVPELVLCCMLQGMVINKRTSVYLGEQSANTLTAMDSINYDSETTLAELILLCNENIYRYETLYM